MNIKWNVDFGLKINIQLNTKSGADVNTQANMIDLEIPSIMPIVNKEIITLAIKFELAVKGYVTRVQLKIHRAVKSLCHMDEV